MDWCLTTVSGTMNKGWTANAWTRLVTNVLMGPQLASCNFVEKIRALTAKVSWYEWISQRSFIARTVRGHYCERPVSRGDRKVRALVMPLLRRYETPVSMGNRSLQHPDLVERVRKLLPFFFFPCAEHWTKHCLWDFLIATTLCFLLTFGLVWCTWVACTVAHL